ncbi:MAG: T9SS type A sorting domain-containing protein [Tenuifilaceae bacterium]|nr:T9SS type A sorting domain-containing protein [Tenuifilaceae bacterium]
MKKILSLYILLVVVLTSFAGDTLKIMQYNLLYYDKITQWCSEANNSVERKNEYLKTITSHYKPDIFTVNEMNGSSQSTDKLLNNVFNTNGLSNYKRAEYTGSYIVNMLYYNSEKLALKSQSYILTSPRITDVYQLYYKSDNLQNTDTVFITCMVMHLKAGSNSSDASKRETSSEQIMSYIQNYGIKGNVFLMGDFNVYTSSEKAFQNFLQPTSPGVQLVDPVNALGKWHDNANFSAYHTQSTHTESGCPSSGGMDDRFDFILASKPVMQGSMGVIYVNNSYWAFGQDGNRLDGSLIDEPTNTSLPPAVINALYNMSDHLPVVMSIYADTGLLSSSTIDTNSTQIIDFVNPVNDSLTLRYKGQMDAKVSVSLINQNGSVVLNSKTAMSPNGTYYYNVQGLPSGVYILKVKSKHINFSNKIVKL